MNSKTYKERKQKGLCVKCGREKEDKTKSHCEVCRKLMRKYYKNRQARKKAYAGKDKEPKRQYVRKVKADAMQIQACVNDLEQFITRLPKMTASEYLEERTTLIKTIMIRGN